MCLNTLENMYLNTLQEKKKNLLSIGSRKIIIVIHFFLGVLKNILLMLCAMLPINFSLFSGLNAIINWKLLSLKTLKISHFPDSMIVHLLFYGSIHFANQCHTSLCSCVFFLFMFTTLNSLVLPCASLITLLSVSFWSLHYLSGSW